MRSVRMPASRAARSDLPRSAVNRRRRCCNGARSPSAAMRSSRRNSASSPRCSLPTWRRSCRCSPATWRRTASAPWRAAADAGRAARRTPPSPTSPNTWRTNAATWCRATRASSSCAASTRCARASTGCRRASSCWRAAALNRDERRAVKLRVLVRLLEIQRVLLRHGLDDYVRATHLYRPLRFLFFISPGVWFERRRNAARGERLRLALQDLGPIFVKFGQAVSPRRDLLPPDIADELAKLQDRVPPFPGELARAQIELVLRKPLGEVLAELEEAALAATSIPQVHAALLPHGEEVVVKVLRPGMRAMIERDLEVLHALADLAHRYWSEGRRLRPREIVDEYQTTLLDELDLMREAANASQLKRNFAGSQLLYVPEVYWEFCRTDVMVMERIRGVPISDLARLKAAGTDIAQLAENGVRIFFTHG